MTDRNLSQWLTYMGSIHVSAIDMGLERVLPVAKRLGVLKADLKKKPTIFTVAGTNGKGSTTATIAAICQSAGLRPPCINHRIWCRSPSECGLMALRRLMRR